MHLEHERRFQWIHAACHEFSEATGWPLSFVEAAEVLTTGAADQARSRLKAASRRNGHGKPASRWTAEVADGVRTVGRLELHPASSAAEVLQPQDATRLAELHRRLLCSQLASSRKLGSLSRELSTLVDLQRNVPAEQHPLGAMERLLRATFELTGFRSVAFMLLDPEQNQVALRITHRVSASRVPHRRRQLTHGIPDATALSSGQVIVHRSHGSESEKWLPAPFTMGLCQRVQSEAGPVGTLWAFDRRDRQPTDRELHVLESIAAQMAQLLERVVLLRESATQKRLRRELEVASESQPLDILRELPTDPGFDAAGTCTSHYEVGGDLCELIPLDSHRTLVAVGDASGDSIPAALVMSGVRGALRAAVYSSQNEATDTVALMHQLNAVLYALTPPHQFMSLVCGVLDTSRKTFTYSNAGHPAPLLWRNRTVTELESHGLLLGVLEETEYGTSTISLKQDDTLVFFSDGISEAMSRRRSMFRSQGITETLKKVGNRSAAEILQAVHHNLQLHINGSGDADDRTLLILRIR